MALLRLMNKLLAKHPESRRRNLAWHAPAIVPVWPQVRPASVTFVAVLQVMHEICSLSRSIGHPVNACWARFSTHLIGALGTTEHVAQLHGPPCVD